MQKSFYNFLDVIFGTIHSARQLKKKKQKKNSEEICKQLKMKIQKLSCFPVIQQ